MCKRLLIVSSCCGLNFSTLNTCLIFAVGAAILIILPKWHVKGVKWLVQSFRVLRVNFARMKFDWLILFMHILMLTSERSIVEPMVADSNQWFATMISRLPHAKCKCWINLFYDRIRYSPSKVIFLFYFSFLFFRNTSITAVAWLSPNQYAITIISEGIPNKSLNYGKQKSPSSKVKYVSV